MCCCVDLKVVFVSCCFRERRNKEERLLDFGLGKRNLKGYYWDNR